ncbi:hypothetical protein Anas_08182 [Armadillidium nasatum]|uniref:Uncharacterized protein n=1 Tax=Armadillidium nasatum TaxID=96803 RepID=A0A5N5T5Q3_9CRUS|nr:hypothetical protein Anas_08182 [Armadillidium nasatum]
MQIQNPNLGCPNQKVIQKIQKQNTMKAVMESIMSPFKSHFPDDIFQSNAKGDKKPFKSVFETAPKLQEFLDSVFSDSEVGDSMKMPPINKLPPNYSNSSSKVHDSKSAKLIVNQTIDKKSGDGFSKFFVAKTYHLLPKTQNLNNNGEKQITITAQSGKDLPKLDTRLNEVEYKGKIDPLDNEEQPQPQNEFQLQKNEGIRRLKREINDQIVNSAANAGKKPIEFPPSELNRFPQSFLNNRNIKLQDLKNNLGGSISKSYVYKNIGGKTTMYIVDHKPKTKGEYVEAFGTNVGGVRPPDLSRDTKVNPSGNDDHQQSLVLVDPEAEVFDLNLVAKEIESRPKD